MGQAAPRLLLFEQASIATRATPPVPMRASPGQVAVNAPGRVRTSRGRASMAGRCVCHAGAGDVGHPLPVRRRSVSRHGWDDTAVVIRAAVIQLVAPWHGVDVRSVCGAMAFHVRAFRIPPTPGLVFGGGTRLNDTLSMDCEWSTASGGQGIRLAIGRSWMDRGLCAIVGRD